MAPVAKAPLSPSAGLLLFLAPPPAHIHVHNSIALTAQAVSNAAVRATWRRSMRMLSMILMARKASGDSGTGVSQLIFPEIQDSFTFDSLPRPPRKRSPHRPTNTKKAGLKPAFSSRM